MTFWDSYKRYFLEFALIFGSIVMAFYFENLREDKRQDSEFISTLLRFRNEVHEEIEPYRNQYDTALISSPIILYQDSILKTVYSILTNSDNETKILALYTFNKNLRPFIDGRFPAGSFEELKQFSQNIMRDSLHSFLSQYEIYNQQDFVHYERVNEELYLFKKFYWDKMDTEIPSEEVAGSYHFRNTVRSLIDIYELILIVDRSNARFRSRFIYQIDKILERNGINTSSLDKSNLLNNPELKDD